MFDSDTLGKDKSLGSVEISQAELIGDEPKWFSLKVTTAQEVLKVIY